MSSFPFIAAVAVVLAITVATDCSAQTTAPASAKTTTAPPLAEFCLEVQRVVVRTAVTPALVLHPDFDGFVKSKAAIEPLTIQEYIWYEDDDQARPVMVSCKLKSADHLNEAFGPGTSAGNGLCQDMNRLTYERVQHALRPAPVEVVIFDAAEEVRNAENPGMTGPDWLKPYEMTWRDESGVLHVRSKGFRVDWTDPRFATMPGRFRGVQYCHLIAPEYLTRLVTGKAKAGLMVGREVTPLPRHQARHQAWHQARRQARRQVRRLAGNPHSRRIHNRVQNLHVLVVGAGIGGLTTALALQRHRIRVSVYEQAPALSEVGAGLTLASNATLVLQHLGLGAVLEDQGVVPGRGAVKDYRNGRTLVDIPRGSTQIERFGAPYCQIHRNDLHTALVAAVRSADPGCLHLGCSLEDFGQDETGVTALFANGQTARGDLLVGCDGIRSTVRMRLFGSEDPRFTGYVAWRGLVPIERLTAPTLVPDSAVWIGPGHFLTRYKIRRGALLNYIAMARTKNWVEEGWSVRSTVEALLAEFRDFEPTARSILMATPPDQCFKWGIFDRDPLPTWTTGRVTLLGDAAHPTTPFLGQGAAMALEDGLVLARALVAAGSVQEALARYELARVARANFVLMASRDNGINLTTTDPDRYDEATHRNEESLDLASYNAVTVPV